MDPLESMPQNRATPLQTLHPLSRTLPRSSMQPLAWTPSTATPSFPMAVPSRIAQRPSTHQGSERKTQPTKLPAGKTSRGACRRQL
jgi:hypothetical protein